MSAQQHNFFTGCAGFHGSALAQKLVRETEHLVVNIDKFIYAGSHESLGEALAAASYRFEQTDVSDEVAMARLFEIYGPDTIVHPAAESHVDRSIDGPARLDQRPFARPIIDEND
ncbi:MAG: GDP-mannose 4,6-dehydratase [Alphaproteobacteria bacterium]